MARTRKETDELLVAMIKWAEADPNAALLVATVKDSTNESGALITLGHAGCSLVSVMATIAELLDLAEEKILASTTIRDASHSLECIREGRIVLGILGRETMQ